MKLFAKITKIFTLPVLIIILIAGLLYSSIRSYTFQNKAAQLLVERLSQDMQTAITIESVEVGWWKRMQLNHVLIRDQQGDTLIYAGKVNAKYSSFDKVNHIFSFKDLQLEDGKVHFEKLKGAKDPNYKFFIDYFKPKKKRDPNKPYITWIVKAEKVSIKNTQFRYHDYNYEQPDSRRFNEYFIEFNKIRGSLDTLTIIDDSLSFHVNSLFTQERSGLVALGMKSDTKIHSKGLEFYNLLFSTPYSILKGQLVMSYSSFDDLEDFIDKVNIEGKLKESKVSIKDIAYFYEDFWGESQIFYVSGNSSGPVKRLDITNLDVKYNKFTKLKGNIDFSGLPDINNTLIDANIKQFETTTTEFTDLLGIDAVSASIASLGKIAFNGSFIGFTHDFVSRGNWQTDLGNAFTDLKFNYADQDVNSAKYKGKLSTLGFNLGPVLRTSTIGKFAGEINLDGTGLVLEKLDLKAKSDIKEIEINNKKVVKANIDGRLAKGLFDGIVNVDDPNLQVSFDGTVNILNERPIIDFEADVKRINLAYFGLDTGQSILSAKIKSNLQGNSIDNIVGNLNINYLKVEKSKKVYFIENATLVAAGQNSNRSLVFNSDMADATLAGNFQLEKLPASINNFLWNIMPAYFDFKKLNSVENFTFDINLKKPELLLTYVPEFVRFKSTKLKGYYNSNANTLQASLQSDEISINNIRLINLTCEIEKPLNQPLTLVYSSSKMQVGNKTVTNALNINAIASNNILNIKLDAISDSLNYTAKLDGDFIFDRDLIDVKINDGGFNINGRNWIIGSDGVIQYREDRLVLENIEIKNNEQLLRLNGAVSDDISDKLLVDFYKFEPGDLLSDLGLLGKDVLQGVANGWIKLYNLYKVPLFESDFKFDKVAWNKDTLGDVAVKAINLNKEIINFDGTKVTSGSFNGLEVSGIIDLNENHENYNLQLDLPTSNISILGGFISNIASNLNGTVEGKNISLKGKFNDPKLNGQLTVKNASFTVDYLETTYKINEAIIELSPNRLTIKPCYIYDYAYNQATLSGAIFHRKFDNWRFDIDIRNINKMHVLNTSKEDNELFYGQGYASGRASFTGPLEEIDIYMNLKTEKGTKVILPLEDDEAQSQVSYIHFKNETENKERKVNKAFSNINSIVIELEATEDAEAEMVFDSKAGDIMRGNGRGNLKFELNKAGDFYMYGTYEIIRGNYLFTAFNFVNKPFVIEKGSTIAWDGDPFNAKIQITAIYKQKASLIPLLDPSRFSSTADYQRAVDALKTPVDVNSKIIMSGILLEPRIEFDIEFPNLQNQGIAAIEVSQIKTRLKNNPQEMNKQFLSLLVFNTFLPVNLNQIGTVASSTPGQSASELLSSQLNNWIGDLGIDSSILINFNLGRDTGNNRNWIVSVEKRFFNDRLNLRYSQAIQNIGSNATNVTVEYNLTADGNIKIRTNYSPFYYGGIYSSTQQQGLGGSKRGTVGVFFRKEFETIWRRRKD